MKSKTFIIMLVTVAIISCVRKQNVYNHTDGIEELGQNYYYLGDGNESQILLNLKPEKTSKFGKTVIPAEVIQYNYNHDNIIAKTMKSNNGIKSYEYWIINKSLNNDSLTPIDSITFFKKIESFKMKLKKRK